MNRVILHIDMDAFYASVEQLDNPSLKGRPVIVGGTSNRGVVSAASYEARRFGVRSAMPIFQARQRCPEGIFMPVRMQRYKEVSKRVIDILKGFSPLVEQVSIDEAYVDSSGADRLFGPSEEIGQKIKKNIKDATSLTCSIGIAPNKFLAKIASDLDKPDGLTIIHPDDVPRFIQDLAIEKVPGVGKKTVQTLHEMGVLTLGDVQRLKDDLLLKKTGKFGKRLLELSRGIDDSPVVPFIEAKSISSEETLPEDTNDPDRLKRRLLIQSEIVGRRLRGAGLEGSTVTLKLKRSDFKQMTRSVTLDRPTHSSNTIYEQGLRLLEHFDLSSKFRLIGIGLSSLLPAKAAQRQLDLFEEIDYPEKPWEDAEKAMDTIKERFGGNAIKRGGMMNKSAGGHGVSKSVTARGTARRATRKQSQKKGDLDR